MADRRLRKCRESYQIVNCKICGRPTTNFENGGICGGCLFTLLGDSYKNVVITNPSVTPLHKEQ